MLLLISVLAGNLLFTPAFITAETITQMLRYSRSSYDDDDDDDE